MLPEVVVAFVDQRAPTFVKSRGERPAGAWIKIELRMTVKNLMKYLDYRPRGQHFSHRRGTNSLDMCGRRREYCTTAPPDG